MSDNVLTVVPSKTDAEFAADLRNRAIAAYQPILDLMDEASKNDFGITTQLGMGGLGKSIIQQLQIYKVYK